MASMNIKRGIISLTLYQGEVRMSPLTFLGSGRFEMYLSACKSLRAAYDPNLKSHLIPIIETQRAIDLLRSVGLDVQVSPHLLNSIKEQKVDIGESSAEAHLGFIKREYEKRKVRLFDFQELGVKFLNSRRYAALFDDMGTGKSAQSLSALPVNAPVLIVCPAVVKVNWQKEAKIWRPEFSSDILSGKDSFRWPKPNEIIIVNYDILPPGIRRGSLGYGMDDKFGKPVEGTVVIADEVHYGKSNRAARTSAIKAVCTMARRAGGRNWILTGTPLLNRPSELWTILGIADLQREAYDNWNNFVRIFRGTRTGFKGAIEWGTPNRVEAATGLTRVAMRRTIDDVVKDLPPIRFQDIEVNIDQQTTKQCDIALRELNKIGVSLEDALTQSIQKKDDSHAFYELSKARSMLGTAKVPFALSMIEEYEANDEPLVVFSCMRNPIDILKNRSGWAVITGEVTGIERDRVVEEFQGGRLKGVGLTIAAGGVGITLHRASNALFIDYDWVPANNTQAYARIRRIGQRRPQRIVRLVANHELDRQVLRCIDRKLNIINNSITEFETQQRAASSLQQRFVTSEAGAPRSVVLPDRRGPKTANEAWAADAIRRLAEHDPDHAFGVNRVGFNRVDTQVGHQLSDKLEVGLTEREWLMAIKIAKRYPGQVGVAPE